MATAKYVPPGKYAEFRGEHKKDMTATLYNVKVGKDNELFKPTTESIPEMLQASVEKFPTRFAVGHREVLKREYVEEKGKKMEKLTLANEYTKSTYQEYAARIDRLARGLREFYDFKSQDRIAIYAETQEDWMTMAHAAWKLNLTVTTVYATLGPKAAAFGIRQAKCAVIVCDKAMMKTMPEIVKDAPSVKSVVVIGATNVELEGVKTECLENLVNAGVELAKKKTDEKEEKDFPEVKGDDIAVIMYTSGTTGNPKGVLMRHAALVAQAEGAVKVFPQINEEAVHIAYLPLAHIMEIVFEIGIAGLGACSLYASAQTLTASGTKLANETVKPDGVVAKPTVFLFAPAVLDKLYNVVGARFKEATGIKKTVANKALASGLKNQANHKIGAAAFWYAIGFKKAAEAVGGNVKLAICGSAPLSPTIQQFCQTVLNAPLRQGYGLTETLAASCILNAEDNSTNCVGAPTPVSTIRLRDWAEGGYLVADKDNEDIGMPRGEILIGGNALSEGYLVNEDDADAEKMKQKNLEDYIVVDGERFFCTGDIGQVTPQGTVMVIDRKKDLFKGATGEYVSFAKVESLMKVSDYVEMPFVYGRTGKDTVIALVSPMVPKIKELAETLGIEEKNIHKLIERDDILLAVKADIDNHLKPLKKFERPSAIRLCLEKDGTVAWTTDNEYLTAAQKIKRPAVAKGFESLINDAYDRDISSKNPPKKDAAGKADATTKPKESPKVEKKKSVKKQAAKKQSTKDSPKVDKKKSAKKQSTKDSPKVDKKKSAKKESGAKKETKVQAKAEETKEEAKAEETKEEAKAEETKEEAKAEETKEEAKAEETKVDAKAEETKEEAKAEEAEVEEPKAEEPKAEEPKVDAQAEEPKAEETKEEPKVEAALEEPKAEETKD